MTDEYDDDDDTKVGLRQNIPCSMLQAGTRVVLASMAQGE